MLGFISGYSFILSSLLFLESITSLFSFFNKGGDTEIKWDNITKIGEDVILVKIVL